MNEQIITHPNLEIVNKFFEAYGKHDLSGIREGMAENVKWIFPGHHPLSGPKVGIDQVVAFFDSMGGIMGRSNVKAEKLVTGVNDSYVVECQHIQTDREDSNNLDQRLCVLWEFEGGKIIRGEHLAADEDGADDFFNKLAN